MNIKIKIFFHLSIVEGEHATFGAVGVLRILLVLHQEHVDKTDEEARRAATSAGVKLGPLVENQNDQISEHTGQKNHLWKKFTNDVYPSLEIPEIYSISYSFFQLNVR